MATREREKEEAARKKQMRPILRSGRRRFKIFKEKSRLRRGSSRTRTKFRRRLWLKAK